MSIAGVTGMGRKRALSRMTEMVTIGSASAGTIDPVTLQPAPSTTVTYQGVGRVKFPSLVVSTPSPQGQSLAVQDVTLSLPVGSAPDVSVGDTIIVTFSSVDAGLVGRKFRVKGLPQMGQVSAHRFPIEYL